MRALDQKTRDEVIRGVRAGRDAVAIAARHQISPVTVWRIARNAGESKPRPGAWTEARIAELRRLCADNLPFREIGAALGITKNMALGKAHRLGITNGRAQYDCSGVPKRKYTRATMPRIGLGKPAREPREHRLAQEPVVAPVMLSEAPKPLRLTLLELTSKSCRYPSGNPREASFSFCGNFTAAGTSWCSYHRSIVFRSAVAGNQS